jgi:hypothetical protein
VTEDDPSAVWLAIASAGTSSATELTIRTAVRHAGVPVDVVVGDCGSRDGSIRMLERLQRGGLVQRLEQVEGRAHSAWLDHWVATCPAERLAVADSDVEFLRPGWLREMLDEMDRTGAALVTCEYVPESIYVHPNSFVAPTSERPAMHVMVLDVPRVRALGRSFAYELVERDGTWVHNDTGAAVGQALGHGSGWVAMPTEFLSAYVHAGGLSWRWLPDRLPTSRAARAAERIRQARVRFYVRRRLLRARVLK